MKVAVFNKGEAFVCGFCPEGHPDSDWLFDHYPKVELTEDEVNELEAAFTAFQKAQNKIWVLIAKAKGMYDVSEIENEDQFIRNGARK